MVSAFVAQVIQTTVSVPTFAQPFPVVSVNSWIVWLNRFDGSVEFNGTWVDYREGFGNVTGEYWLGLEKLTQLTNNGQYRARYEFKSIQNESWFSSEYDSFLIDPESNWYQIHVGGFFGDAGDHLNYPHLLGIQNGMNFTTVDSDNDRAPNNCAVKNNNGGYWFNYCGAHSFTAEYGAQWFYNRWLTDYALASNSRLEAVRGMIKRV